MVKSRKKCGRDRYGAKNTIGDAGGGGPAEGHHPAIATPGRAGTSVAEHCWMMTLMAYFVRDEFPEADMDRVIRMCLIQ